MKYSLILLFALLTTGSSLLAQGKAGKTDTTKHLTLYSCVMHPDYVTDAPGKCPKCGMDLQQTSKEKMKADVVKSYQCPIHGEVVQHKAGTCPKCGKALTLTPKEQMKAEVVKLYTCPMHPDVALTKDGVCPKCGKDLVEKKEKHHE